MYVLIFLSTTFKADLRLE